MKYDDSTIGGTKINEEMIKMIEKLKGEFHKAAMDNNYYVEEIFEALVGSLVEFIIDNNIDYAEAKNIFHEQYNATLDASDNINTIGKYLN